MHLQALKRLVYIPLCLLTLEMGKNQYVFHVCKSTTPSMRTGSREKYFFQNINKFAKMIESQLSVEL